MILPPVGEPARPPAAAGPRRIRCAVSLAAVVLFTCCSSAGAPPARTSIEFWHAMRGAGTTALEALVQQFNESQPAVAVKPIFKGTYPEVLTAAITAYQRKAPPHLAQVFDIGTLSMLRSHAIVPVYRLMEQQQISVNWADILPTVTAYYAENSRLYSLPFNASTPILYYNKAIFRKAGLPVAPPATWPAVEAAAQRILATGAASCGFTTGGSPSWGLLENAFPWHDHPFATNQNGYDGLDTRLLLNSDFGRMHVRALARWHRARIFESGGQEGRAERFAQGACAMAVASSGEIGGFARSLPFDWGTGPLPHWGPPYPKANTMVGGATLWVFRGHSAPEYRGVAQFLKFLADPRQQAWWAATTGFLPITKTALDNLDEGGFYKQNPEQWTAMTQLLNAEPTANSRGLRLGNYAEVREAIELELDNILAGRKTVEDGLATAVARGNAILREFAVTHGAAAQGEI